jgi:hypothetical protein
MLTLYVFALIVGGGLLLLSLFGAGEGGLDGDAEAATDGLSGLTSSVLEAGQLVESEASLGEPAVGWSFAREFLSVRSLFYLLAGFGATGMLLEGLTSAPPITGFIVSAATGMVAATAAAALYGWIKRSESGLVPATADHLTGLAAQVVLAVLPGQRGKVRLLSGGREVELLARLYAPTDPECARGSTVVIVDVQGDTALVTPAPPLPEDLYGE